MYKYYFLNEKKLHSRTCAFHMLHDCYYTRGTASIVKKERLFIFTCTVSTAWSLEEDSDLTFEIKQIFVDILMVKYFLYQKVD